MATKYTKTKVSKRGNKVSTVEVDTSKMTGRQKLKAQKIDASTKTAATKLRTQAIKSASRNIGQAITAAAGTLASNRIQSEQTKRLQISAAQQATNGGLQPSDNTRDEDEEKDDTRGFNPQVWGRR